jgi:cellulose synthase operon protein C
MIVPPGHAMRLILTAVLLAARLVCQESAPVDWREDVEEALADGRERVALGILAKQIEAPAAAAAALELFADVAWNVGDLDRAEAAGKRWVEEHPGDPRALIHRARQLWRRGRHPAALEVLAPLLEPSAETETAPKWSFPAIALAGSIRADRGEDAAAEKLFDSLVVESQRVVLRDPKDLAALADAVLFFGGKQGVNEAEKNLIEAQKGKLGPEVDCTLGWLYLERKSLWADAVAEFKAALKKRPAYVPALVGLHAALAAGGKKEEADAAINRALATAPGHPDVLAVQVAQDLGDFRPEQAAEKVTRGLLANPAHKPLLALRAAREMVLSRKAEGDRVLEELLKLDPTYGEGLRIVASVLNERRRWPECLELMKRAVEIDPKNPDLFDDCARYALYLGQNELADEMKQKADDADAFGTPWRHNIWELMRWLGKHYTTVETEHFKVVLFHEDRAVLSKVMLPFLERSYDILTKKYRYTPEGVKGPGSRLLVEVYKTHASFSVRTFGFVHPGILGVCFGPFIAMDAPNVEGMGTHAWARTFHHELAHTMTVGISKGRVPRWLTEGLSTFEELEFDPSWTRGMDRELFDAYHTGELMKLADFDNAFGTPRIIFAYYQGGLEAAYLVKTYGMDKVLGALKLFAEDLPQEEVFKRAFGVPTSEIDEGFRKVVAERIAPMKMQPRYRPDVLEKMEAAWKASPKDDLLAPLAWARYQNKRLADAEALLAEAAKRKLADSRLKLLEARIAEKMQRGDRAKVLFAELANEGVKDYDLAFDLARAAQRRGEADEAIRLFREAIACFPTNAGDPNPRTMLAGMLRGEGKTDEAIALLEEHLAHAPDDLKSRREVIDYHKATGNAKRALAQLDQYVLIQPFDDAVHGKRSDLLLAEGAPEEALFAAELAVATAKEPPKKASAHVAAARALLRLGRRDEARERVAEALRISPRHGAATAMLGELDSRPAGDHK